MDNELEERIMNHAYCPNPLINEYLVQQRRRSEDHKDHDYHDEHTTVRERHHSGMSVASAHSRYDDQVDIHERCITPLPDDTSTSPYHHLYCIVCRDVAINPFRCTTLEESNCVVEGYLSETKISHLCCYQCLCEYMLILRTDRFKCPICQVNEFNHNNLVYASESHTKEAEDLLVVYCPNHCGLMGSPIAIANHICVFQNPKQPGHTSHSNDRSNLIIANSNLNIESNKLREQINELKEQLNESQEQLGGLRKELDEVIQNHSTELEYWRSKFDELHQTYLSDQVRLDLLNNINSKQRQRLEQKSLMIERLQEQKREAIRHYKSNISKVVKVYKTQIQELIEINERLNVELKVLIDMSVPGAGAMVQIPRPRSDSSPVESGDEHSLGFPNLFGSLSIADNAQRLPMTDSSDDEETNVSNLD